MLDQIRARWLACFDAGQGAHPDQAHAAEQQNGLLKLPALATQSKQATKAAAVLDATTSQLLHAQLPCPVHYDQAAQALQLLPNADLPAVILRVERCKPNQQGEAQGLEGLEEHETETGPRSRLQPAWCNAALIKHYNLSSMHDYQRILRRLASKDPLLIHIFEKAIRQLQPGRSGVSCQHVTAEPFPASGQAVSLLGLRLTACWWSAEDTQVAALLVQHGVPFSVTDVVPRVLRDYVTLNVLPTIVTVVTFQGKVLYQNASSLVYYGDFTCGTPHSASNQLAGRSSSRQSPARNRATDRLSAVSQAVQRSLGSANDSTPVGDLKELAVIPDDKNLLKQLFNLDPAALEEALDVLSSTSQWSGVVQVPLNMKRHMRAARQQRRASFATMATFSDIGPDPRASLPRADAAECASRISAMITQQGKQAAGSARDTLDDSHLLTSTGNRPSWGPGSSLSEWQQATFGSIVHPVGTDTHEPGSISTAQDTTAAQPESPGADFSLAGVGFPGTIPMVVSSDSYEFDAAQSSRLQWPWQANLEPVQEAELELDVDLLMAEGEQEEDAQSKLSLDPVEASATRSHPVGPRGQEGLASGVQSRSGSRDPERDATSVEALSGYLNLGSDGGAMAGAASGDARSGALGSGRQSQDVHRMSNLSINSGLRESISDRSFSLKKSVTAVLDVIERKRHHMDLHSGGGVPQGHSPHAFGRPSSGHLAYTTAGSGFLPGLDSHPDSPGAGDGVNEQRMSWCQKRTSTSLSKLGSSNIKLGPGDAHSDALTELHGAGGHPGVVSNALLIANGSAASESRTLPAQLGPQGASGYTDNQVDYAPSPFKHNMQATHQGPPPGHVAVPVAGSGGASPPCWHEITAIPVIDPVLDQRVLLITQTDVSKRVDVERKLADLTTAQMSMLEQMFPRHVIEHMLSEPGLLSSDVGRLANDHEMVSVLFADVVGFTNMSKEISASAVMMFLNALYSEFDNILEEYGLYQLDTMGDCYIVVGGLLEPDEQGFQALQSKRTPEQAAQDAHNIMQFAKAMLVRASQVCMPHNGEPVRLRIGIHSGRLVSGMLGSRLPKFTLFGDTMNTASRMESTSVPGCVQVSDATHALLQQYQQLASSNHPSVAGYEPRTCDVGGTWVSTTQEVKGKGIMNTFLFHPDVFSMPDPPSSELLTQATNIRGGQQSLAGHASMAFSSAAMTLAHAMSGHLHDDSWEEHKVGTARTGNVMARRSFYNVRDNFKTVERAMTGKLASSSAARDSANSSRPSYDGSTATRPAYPHTSMLLAGDPVLELIAACKGVAPDADQVQDIPSAYKATAAPGVSQSSTDLSSSELTGALSLPASAHNQASASGRQAEAQAAYHASVSGNVLPQQKPRLPRVRTVPCNLALGRREEGAAAPRSYEVAVGRAAASPHSAGTVNVPASIEADQNFLYSNNTVVNRQARAAMSLPPSGMTTRNVRCEEVGHDNSGPFAAVLSHHRLPLVVEDSGKLEGTSGDDTSNSCVPTASTDGAGRSAAHVPTSAKLPTCIDIATQQNSQPSSLDKPAGHRPHPSGLRGGQLHNTGFLMNRPPAYAHHIPDDDDPAAAPLSLPVAYVMHPAGMLRGGGTGGDVARLGSPSRSRTSGGYHQTGRSRRGSSLVVLGSLGAALNHVAAGEMATWQDLHNSSLPSKMNLPS